MKTIKTILRTAMILVLVAVANSLMAAGTLNVEIQPLAASDAVLAISRPNDSNLKITVADKKGKVVYYKEIAGEGNYYRHFVNFSNFSKGEYKVTVVSNGQTSEKMFEISSKSIKVLNEKGLLEN